MSTAIDNAAAARTVQGADWTPNTSGLTAEGVMTYCASRLNSLDALIKSRFSEQQKRNGALKEAGDVIARLNGWTIVAKGESLDPKGKEIHRGYAAGLAAMYNNTTDPEVKNKIADAFKMVTGNNLVVAPNGKAEDWQTTAGNLTLNLPGIEEVTAAQWQGFIGGVKTVQDGLTKDSELSMIQLQSIVSQRQLAVQMTTQMLQTMHESSKQVVSNIR